MNPLKIAVGVVLGLICWHLLIVWSDHQDKVERQQRLDRAFETAVAECKSGKQQACNEAYRLNTLQLQKLNQDLERYSQKYQN